MGLHSISEVHLGELRRWGIWRWRKRGNRTPWRRGGHAGGDKGRADVAARATGTGLRGGWWRCLSWWMSTGSWKSWGDLTKTRQRRCGGMRDLRGMWNGGCGRCVPMVDIWLGTGGRWLRWRERALLCLSGAGSHRAGLQGEAGHAFPIHHCQIGTPLSQHVAFINQAHPVHNTHDERHQGRCRALSPLSRRRGPLGRHHLRHGSGATYTRTNLGIPSALDHLILSVIHPSR